MEEIKKEEKSQSTPKKKWWWGWILIDYAIFNSFKDIKVDETHLFLPGFLLLSLFLAPMFYYWLKEKWEKKNHLGGLPGQIATGIVTIVIFTIAISLLGQIADRAFL